MPDSVYHTDCSNKVVRHLKGHSVQSQAKLPVNRVISTHLSLPNLNLN